MPTPGWYYIYTQIYSHFAGTVHVRVNRKAITVIQPEILAGSKATLNAAGLFSLKAGDVISLYAAVKVIVFLEREHTYFGAFLI